MSEETVRLENLKEILEYVIVRNVGMGQDLTERILRRCDELRAKYPEDTKFGFVLSNDHSLVNLPESGARPASEQLYFHCFTLGPDGRTSTEVNTFYLVSFKLGMIDDQTNNIYTVH
jgi:hypothetical protein